MPTTSPDGIYYADSSTAMSAEAISAAEATSVQDALTSLVRDNRQIQTFVWADATARGAQAGMIAGDEGYQTDTAITYRYSGSAWVPWLSARTSFTPTWTNLTVGTGTNLGIYYISGGMCHVEVATTLGAGFSVGAARLTLPLTASFLANNLPVGRIAYVDNGVGTFRGDLFAFSSTQVDLRYPGGALFWSAISSATPFTWASTDSLLAQFSYPLA